MMRRGRLSALSKQLFRSATFVTIFSLTLVACVQADQDTKSDPSQTISALPRMSMIEGYPQIMGPSVIHEGVWLYENEGSQFFEKETRIRPHYDDIYFDTWLSLNIGDPTFPPESPLINYKSDYGTNSANFVFVKFIGRRNVLPSPFGFGHLGTSRNVVVVEKIISAKPLSR